MNGILNILKPPGMTSQNVVSRVKRTLKVDKVGHTGTLDPGAAGVLPICIGKATRISDYLLHDKKYYRAELTLGLRSDTLDKYGNIESLAIPELYENKIREVFEEYKGEIEQIPPMFSAVKYGGKKLYELARKGIVIERKTRYIYIYDINILKIVGNKILFDVICSKGTYIRTLCSDIGKSLGSDAIMSFLLRTKTGIFSIENAITLDELDTKALYGDVNDVLYPIHSVLHEYDRVYVSDDIVNKVKNGVGFELNGYTKYESRQLNELILIFDRCENFIASGKKMNNRFIKIEKVFL